MIDISGWEHPFPSRAKPGERMDDDRDIKRILRDFRTIAVVGLSHKPDRPSHRVARYMQERGYRIVPVRPGCGGEETILGEKVYPTLRDIPFPVELVNVFRRPEAVPGVVDAALAMGARALWLQEGITHPEAEARARSAGLLVVADHCLLKAHMRLVG